MDYYARFTNSTTKAPITGLTLAWSFLIKGADGTAFTPQPSFTELANGLYKFTIAATQDLLGRIDGGSSLATQDRYADVSLSANDASVAQTGDSFARIGAPSGASVSADVASIQAKTTNLPASPAAVGSNMGTVASVTAAVSVTGDFSATMKTSLNASTPASVQNIAAQTGDAFARIGANGAALTALSTQTSVNAIPTAPLLASSYTAPPTVAAIRTEMDSNSTKLANLDAAVSTRSTLAAGAAMTLTAAYDPAKSAASAASVAAIPTTPMLASSYTAPPDAGTVAAAVWGAGSRSLTTFGTLVADIATAVWGAATRTLSAFGFTATLDASQPNYAPAKVADVTAAIAGIPDPMAEPVAGSNPVITRGQALDKLYIPAYVGPMVVVPAASSPNLQVLYGHVKELGAQWATGNLITVTPATQVIGDNVISSAPQNVVVADDGSFAIQVDKGAAITLQASYPFGGTGNVSVKYFTKTITVSDADSADITSY